jgi:hypothetical protein
MTGRRRLVSILAVAGAALGGLASTSVALAANVQLPGAPLTVSASADGQFQSYVTAADGTQTYSFYPSGDLDGDAGAFFAFPTGDGDPAELAGSVFGFNGSAGPTGIQPVVPVSQSGVGGDGTTANPYSVTTVYDVVGPTSGAVYLEVTQTTTYVSGDHSFTNAYSVQNVGPSPLSLRSMIAGDLFTAGDDSGVGFAGEVPRSVGGYSVDVDAAGGFDEAPPPSPAWSGFEEGSFADTSPDSISEPGIWNIVENGFQPAPFNTPLPGATPEGAAPLADGGFNDTIDPNLIDNAAGVQFDTYLPAGHPLPPGGAFQYSIVVFADSVPVNTVPPTISGNALQGATLTESHGTWTTNPTSYTYQWLRCSATGTNCSQIPGATNQTYTLGGGDPGSEIEVQEVASNASGPSSPETSTATAAVLPLAPVNAAAPTITGTPAEGATLTEVNGIWTNNPTSYADQWLQCTSLGQACQPIDGATGPTYVPVASEVGQTIAVAETAANAGGTGDPAVSAVTAAVGGPNTGTAPPGVQLATTTTSSSTGATFVGRVSPAAGAAGAPVTYYFEYGTTTAYGARTGSAMTTPVPAGTVVRASVSGLLPDTTYHYRLVASDCAEPACTARTGDQSVTTGSSLAPVLEQTIGVAPVSGTITVRRRGSNRFVVLRTGELMPLGATVDAKHGVALIVSATAKGIAHDASGQFSRGRFTVSQPSAAFAVLDLDSSFAACSAHASGLASTASTKSSRRTKRSTKTVNEVFGNAHGAFETHGRYATAADEGTQWLTADRCDGTLVQVTQGTVKVTDLVHHRTLSLQAGHSHLS